MKSGMLLGLRQEDDVFVIESPYVYLGDVCGVLADNRQAFPR